MDDSATPNSAWPVLSIERAKKGSLVEKIVDAISAMVASRELVMASAPLQLWRLTTAW
jgi:hypothetical protein